MAPAPCIQASTSILKGQEKSGAANTGALEEVLHLLAHYGSLGGISSISVLFDWFTVTNIDIMQQNSGLSGFVTKTFWIFTN